MPDSKLPALTAEQTAALSIMERALNSEGDFGCIVHLTGPFGSGKTALARALYHRLQHSGVQVFGLTAGHPGGLEELSARLRRILEHSSKSPLVIIIDEWETVIHQSSRVKALAEVQRVLRDVVSRGPKNGIVLISALTEQEDWRKILPEALLARMVVARLSTNLRGKTLESIRHPVVRLPQGALQIRFQADLEHLRHCFDEAVARDQFERIDHLLSDPRVRSGLAIHLESLASGRKLPGFDTVAVLLERLRVLQRRDGEWIIARWLREMLEEAGLGQAAVDAYADDVIEKVSVSLDALAWERYLRALMSTRRWLEDEVSASGIELPMSDGALPTLAARLGQKPREFVAALFRPSDLKEFMRPGERRAKELILEDAFRGWQEGAR